MLHELVEVQGLTLHRFTFFDYGSCDPENDLVLCVKAPLDEESVKLVTEHILGLDRETRHAALDTILLLLARQHGYGDFADTFRETRKWYA